MKSILIIDDEPDIRTYLKAVFQDNGFSANDFDGGDVSAAQVILKKPDLILLDILMPQRSGISIYTELRQCSSLSRVPVILMTGMSLTREFSKQEFHRLIEDKKISPPECFLEKPIQIDMLLKIIRRILNQK